MPYYLWYEMAIVFYCQSMHFYLISIQPCSFPEASEEKNSGEPLQHETEDAATPIIALHKSTCTTLSFEECGEDSDIYHPKWDPGYGKQCFSLSFFNSPIAGVI